MPFFLWLCALRLAAAPHACTRIVVEGVVSRGETWNLAIGNGWVFRIVPIQAHKADYSGWDLVLDREPSQGYPDALLIANPPFGSLNEREIGTTFGLRAQDAIGWNPRSFRFLTDPVEFARARADYLTLMRTAMHGQKDTDSGVRAAASRLLSFQRGASAGEFRILDARLVPGIADPAPFARSWAASRPSYQVIPPPAGRSTPSGTLDFIRFSLTLWLPNGWRLPSGMHGTQGSCGG